MHGAGSVKVWGRIRGACVSRYCKIWSIFSNPDNVHQRNNAAIRAKRICPSPADYKYIVIKVVNFKNRLFPCNYVRVWKLAQMTLQMIPHSKTSHYFLIPLIPQANAKTSKIGTFNEIYAIDIELHQ